MQGLDGVKVLELGHMVSAAYATKLMADLGAEVIKVEEPSGDRARQRGPFPQGAVDPEQSGLFLYLNTNKQGVTLDLHQDRDALARLVAWADLLVHNYPPAQMAALGINYATFRAINPRLVMCSLTPFGLTGPYKDYQAYELTVAHGGGWVWLSPGGSDRPDLPPLKAAGHQAEFQGGVAAATATLAANSRALQTGEGEDLVEDAHLNERGFFVRLPHPEVGVQTHLGKPWLLTSSPNGVRSPAPLLGQDTDQVMHEVFGYSTQEIARLKEQRVLY